MSQPGGRGSSREVPENRDGQTVSQKPAKAFPISNGMKLVIATPLYPPEIGGPATYAKILAEELPKRGVHVELVKFSDVRHFPKLFRHYVYFRRVLRAARTADLVMALDPVSVGLPGMHAAKRAGKPFVVKIVGDYAWEQGRQRFGVSMPLDEFVKSKQPSFQVRLLQKIQNRTAEAAHKVIVPSKYLKGVVEAWGVPSDKITVIYNAVRTEEVGNVPEAVAALPRPLVVTAGRLVPWKGIEGVVHAVSSIPGASLAIVGDGPDRASLETKAKHALPGRAVFTGVLSHGDTLAVMKGADVFVLNSAYEGLSHLLIEAVSLGVPVVATNVGGNPEVISDEKMGILFPHEDSVALQNALRKVLGDDQIRRDLSARAEESAKRYSVENMLTATVETLQAP